MLDEYLQDAGFKFADLWQGVYHFGCYDMKAAALLGQGKELLMEFHRILTVGMGELFGGEYFLFCHSEERRMTSSRFNE